MAEPLRILVSGKNGQITRALQKLAISHANIELHATTRNEMNLTDEASILRTIAHYRPHLVISAAAYTAVDKAESEIEIAHAVNAMGPATLSQAAQNLNIPIIHISTDFVFESDHDNAHKENDPTNPANVYGRTKLEGERLVAANNPRHIIIRTAWVFDALSDNFVRTMLRLSKSKAEISVVSDQIGNPTAADDIAEALLQITLQILDIRETSNNVWGTYHTAGSGVASWADFARYIFKVSNQLGGPTAIVNDIASEEFATLARRPHNSTLDCSAARLTFSINMPGWKSSCRRVVEEILALQKN